MARCPPSLPQPTGHRPPCCLHPEAGGRGEQRRQQELTKEDAVSFLQVKAWPRSEVKSNDSQSHQLVPCAAVTGRVSSWHCSTAPEHPVRHRERLCSGRTPSKGTDRMPWPLHCSQESQAPAPANAVPRLRGILSWARGFSAVMVPTRRARNPLHLLNSKTVNTLRTGRLDLFPSRERTMLCSSS